MRDVATQRGYRLRWCDPGTLRGRAPTTRTVRAWARIAGMGVNHPGSDGNVASTRAWALPAAAGLAALENTALIAALALTAPRAAPLAIALLALKYPFCLGTLRRLPGAYLVVWLWEIAGVSAALAKPGLSLSTRLLELTAAGGCIYLLARSAAVFPSPTLPGQSGRR